MTSASTFEWRKFVDGKLSVISSSRGFTVTIILYLGVLYALRLTLFPGASEDDAETLFLAQSLEGGYKSGQPPLYIWLAHGLTQLFGPALPVVVGLKFACLAAIYIFTHGLARLFTGDGKWAAVAGLSVLGIYYLSWDAVLNYSQTVLLAVLALAFTHALVRLAKKESSGWMDYVWFGFLMGAGVLTKYNFAILAISLLLAAMMDGDLRQKLLGLRGLVSAIVAAGMLLPHELWLMSGGLPAGSLASAVPPSEGAIVSRLGGLLDMVVAIISVLSPLLILLILFFPRAAGASFDVSENHKRWCQICERGFCILFVIMTIMVLVTGISEVRNHWFIILAPFPAYAVLRIAGVYPSWQQGQLPGRIAGYVCLLAGLGLAVGIGLTGRALTQPAACTKCKMVVPYEQLANGLKDAGFKDGTVYVHDFPTQVGGNLRRYFPDSRFVSYKFQSYSPPARNATTGQCLAVWLLGAGEQSPPAGFLLGQLEQRLGVLPIPADTMRILDVTLPGRVEPLSYGYVLIDDLARQGACR